MAKKKKTEDKDKTEERSSLEGFNIQINEFGEIISNFQIDEINKFLTENVEDKKLSSQEEE